MRHIGLLLSLREGLATHVREGESSGGSKRDLLRSLSPLKCDPQFRRPITDPMLPACLPAILALLPYETATLQTLGPDIRRSLGQ